MRRFNDAEIATIFKLRKKGESLYEICKILNVKNMNKSSIYYHLRKNFGRSYKLVKINTSNLDHIGEIVGAFASDGDVVPQSDYQVRFHFSFDEKTYVNRFVKILEEVFAKRPCIYKRSNVFIIRYRSKMIYEFLLSFLKWEGKKSYSVRLTKLKHNKNFLIGFLRGYFDGDGYAEKHSKAVEFVTTSKVMAKQIVKVISILSIKPNLYRYEDKRKNRRTCFYVKIRGENAIKLIEIIKPRNPKRIRDWARSSVWSRIPATTEENSSIAGVGKESKLLETPVQIRASPPSLEG